MTRFCSRSTLARPSWPLLALALVASSLGSCDNPACIFGPSVCQGQVDGGANAVTATFPETGELVLPEQPRVEAMFPSGFSHPESPIVLIFSEAISPPSVQNAFDLRTTNGTGNTAGPNVALIGDGRVLILIPPPLVPGQEYELAFATASQVRDLSGALALRPEDDVIGTFTVDPDPLSEPRLLMTWPLDASTGASPLTEVVTVFDRILLPTSITASSWDVLVDGVDPPFDPLPEPLLINGGVTSGGAVVEDSRVWSWRSVDPATDSRVSLGEGAQVTVELSAGVVKIATPDGNELLATSPGFTTANLSPPSALAIQSEPTDAIGIESLNGVSPLTISVDLLDQALEGDVLEMFIVGLNPNAFEDGVPRISLQREFALSAGAVSALIGQPELLLLQSVVPLVALVEDGDVGLGFAIRRGTQHSVLRVLDVDLATDGIQDARLDLVRPEFVTLLGKQPGETVFASDLREISIGGFASETPRSVEMIANLSTGAVDNRVGGQLPPLPALAATGAFLPAPLNIGQLAAAEMPLSVTLIVYDRALNASDPFFVDFIQRGSSGPGTALLGSGLDVKVVVYDALTLDPIVGAMVFSHESVGGVVTAFAPPAVLTNALGAAAVRSAPTGETLISVQAAGYDLFTFQGVPTTRLDIPMSPDTIQIATSLVVANSQGSALASPFIDNFAADSRVLLPGDAVRGASNCDYNTLTDFTTCSFLPPLGLRAGETGLVTYLATKQPSNLSDPNLFSAGTFLQAFEMVHPRAPLEAGSSDNIGLFVEQLLSGAEVDPQDIPLGTAPQVFQKPPNFSLDFPNPIGDPRVSIEAFAPGIGGMLTVGMGRPYFDASNDRWDIRAAYSARAKAGGEFATDLTIEDERFLRVEIVDGGGNRTGVRQAMESANGLLAPPGVPLLTAPAGVTGGAAYDLVYENVLDGAQDGLGLYHALLVDSAGRRWNLWTLDPLAAAGPVVTHVPPIAISGGTPLASGPVSCFLDAWSWLGFDSQEFMFRDVVRRHDRFTAASPKVFSQP